MTRRCRVWLTAWVGLIAAAGGVAPAAASPTVGGGSFDDAPLLGAGRHDDTILPYETLFYAVALQEGQRLTVHGLLDLRPGSRSERGYPDARGGFALTLYSPLLERLGSASDPPSEPDPDILTERDVARTPRVQRTAKADAGKIAGTDSWVGPGTYYIAATISSYWGDLGAAVELPLRLDIAIDGPVAPEGSIGSGPLGAIDTTPAATASRPLAPRAAPATRDGARLAAAAAGGAGLLGGVLVALLARRRARAPTR